MIRGEKKLTMFLVSEEETKTWSLLLLSWILATVDFVEFKK